MKFHLNLSRERRVYLMTLQADEDVISFGRLLETKLFSSGEVSDKIILPQKSSEKN